jgi:hypothetical protein|tara:strand:+ start:604 stop:894 length:291 start_codon:yes stop_codon:yes gene_type:complete
MSIMDQGLGLQRTLYKIQKFLAEQYEAFFMGIMDQDESFRKMVEYLEEAADGHGTQVVYVDDVEKIDSEAPEFREKFIVDNCGCIMIPETINGKEW